MLHVIFDVWSLAWLWYKSKQNHIVECCWREVLITAMQGNKIKMCKEKLGYIKAKGQTLRNNGKQIDKILSLLTKKYRSSEICFCFVDLEWSLAQWTSSQKSLCHRLILFKIFPYLRRNCRKSKPCNLIMNKNYGIYEKPYHRDWH